MNEVEFFLSLLDNKGADEVLKVLGDNTKKRDLSFKKFKIKNCISNPGIYNKKHKVTPFYMILKRYKIDKLGQLKKKEFFYFLSNCEKDEGIKEYQKFANALCFYPEETKKMLPKLIENYKLYNEVFTKKECNCNEDEIREYYSKINPFVQEDFYEIFITYCEEELDGFNIEEYDELYKEIKEWGLSDLSNNIKDKCEKYPLYLIQYLYLKNNQHETTKIKNGLIMEIIDGYIEEKQRNFRSIMNDMELKHRELRKQIENYETNLYNIKNQVKILNTANEKLQYEIRESKKERINEVQLLEKENLKLKSEIESLKARITQLDVYNNCAFRSNEDEKIFAVVYSIKEGIFKNIFPEIVFLNGNIIDNELKEKDLSLVNKIYIQRHGLNNDVINKVKEFAQKHNIQCNLFMACNEKELIEQLVKKKTDIGGEKYEYKSM